MTRECLPQHQQSSCPLRAHCCRYCCKQDTYRNITTKHYEICERFPLPCPNKCGKQRIVKKEIEQHLAECPEQMIKCTYLEMGCQETVARRHLEQHKEERKDHHLLLAVDRVAQVCTVMSQLALRQQQLEREVAQLRRERDGCYYSSGGYNTAHLVHTKVKIDRPMFFLCQRKWLENDKAFPSLPWIVKLERFESATASRTAIESKPFFTHPTGHQFCLLVCPNGTGRRSISVFITPMAGPSDEHLQWPFKGKVEISLLNQLVDEEHTSAVVEMTVNRIQPPEIRGLGRGRKEFISYADLLKKESLNRQYLMDDCVYFRVKLQPDKPAHAPAHGGGWYVALHHQ